jgi:pimeloyl-ACP methyl ester carboxylesterase
MAVVERPGFTIHYQVLGPIGGRPLVLVAGLGEQIGSVEYPDEQCELFIDRGFRVVRVDNRDSGLSLPTTSIGAVDLDVTADALTNGVRPVGFPYSRRDMAEDLVAVLDELAIEHADVLGASMGGYIARELAAHFPGRVSALTVVMTGSGALPGDDGPQLAAGLIGGLAAMATPRSREDTIGYLVKQWRWMWGPDYRFDEEWVRQRVTAAFDRSHQPDGIARQVAGGLLSPGLWDAQATIRCPTLVIHGGRDPVFDMSHGQAVSERIPGARLWIDPKMGHVMHAEQWAEIADRAAQLAP